MSSSRPRDLPQRPLNERQRRFVAYYLVSLNATQAAIQAGYSPKTAPFLGYQLLQKPPIQIAITKASQKLAKRTGVDQEMCVAGLYKEATYEGEGSSHSARVSAWSHLADRLWPVPKGEPEKPSGSVTNNNVMVVHGDFDTAGYIELFRGFFDRSVVGVSAPNGAHEPLDTNNPNT